MRSHLLEMLENLHPLRITAIDMLTWKVKISLGPNPKTTGYLKNDEIRKKGLPEGRTPQLVNQYQVIFHVSPEIKY